MPNEKINTAKCPFYKRSSAVQAKSITITCENIMPNIGFDIDNKLNFRTLQDRKDYVELFCGDVYENCPYYKMIIKNYKEED